MVSLGGRKVQKPSVELLFYFFISLSEKIDLGEPDSADKSGVRRRHGEQGWSEGSKTKCGISFYAFFFRFLSISTSENRIESIKVGFDAAMVSKAGRKVRKPSVEFLFMLFFSFSG